MDWFQLLGLLFGSSGIASGITAVIMNVINRKTNKRLEESKANQSEIQTRVNQIQADQSEIQRLKETILWLEEANQKKEERFADQTQHVRKLSRELIEAAEKDVEEARLIGELKLQVAFLKALLKNKKCMDCGSDLLDNLPQINIDKIIPDPNLNG